MPERIDRRHDGEAGAQLPRGVGVAQHRQQVVEQHGAGLLVGMERGLQVDLAAARRPGRRDSQVSVVVVPGRVAGDAFR